MTPLTFDGGDKETRLKRNELILEIIKCPNLYEELAASIIDTRVAYETYSLSSFQPLQSTMENKGNAGGGGVVKTSATSREQSAVDEGFDADILKYLQKNT
jgi:hypothetical protein